MSTEQMQWRKKILQAQIELIQGYYTKIFMDKLTVKEIIDLLESDKNFLQEEANLLEAEILTHLNK